MVAFSTMTPLSTQEICSNRGKKFKTQTSLYGKNACIYNVHDFTPEFLGKVLKVRPPSLAHVILHREFPEYLSPFCSGQDFQGREPTFLYTWVTGIICRVVLHPHCYGNAAERSYIPTSLVWYFISTFLKGLSM